MSSIHSIRLAAPESNGLQASFAPGANMILHSLKLADRELLATRGGLADYVENGSTMGVPLLHPWANRLAGYSYTVDGTEVVLDRDSALFKRDESGLPIHGALPALSRWKVLDVATYGEEASVLASLTWDTAHPAFDLFPFAHRLGYRARVTGRRVEIMTALEPTGDTSVPAAFGFHPYLLIPGGARARAQMTLPAERALIHDGAMIPTGETEPCEPGLRQLGATAWDDGFTQLDEPARFLLAGERSELSVTFLRGYRFAQVFAPRGSEFVCFEPMTAPANALAAGGPDLPMVAPGDRYEAAFAIEVR
jgi:aldose 1-epimerase